jgi:transposase
MRNFERPNGDERKLLRKLYKRSSGNLSRRAHIVLIASMVMISFTASQIAAICHCCRRTVYNTLDRYREEGLVGLFDKPKSGRPRKIDADQSPQVLGTLKQKTPESVNISLHQKWTLKLVVAYLEEELGVRVSQRTVSNWLAKNDWSYHRGKQELQPPKPLIEKEKEAVLKLLQPLDSQKEVILFMDQSGFCLDGLVTGVWMPKDEQKKIVVTGSHDRWWVFGAFNPHTQKVYYRITKKCNSDETILFLHQIRQRFPNKKIHIVLDNASFHHSKRTQAFVERYPEITFHFLPTRATKLNPIERIWLFAKGVVVAGAIFTDMKELYHMLRRFFWHFNEKRIKYGFSLENLRSIWKGWAVVEANSE